MEGKIHTRAGKISKCFNRDMNHFLNNEHLKVGLNKGFKKRLVLYEKLFLVYGLFYRNKKS